MTLLGDSLLFSSNVYIAALTCHCSFQCSLNYILACNVVAPDSTGVLTLSNHGRNINCTATIIYPEAVTIETVNVGTTLELPKPTLDVGIMHKVGLEKTFSVRFTMQVPAFDNF